WDCQANVCCDTARPPGDPLACAATADGGTPDGGGADGGSGGGAPTGCSGHPLSGVRQIAVGGVFACALRGSGVDTEVLCWGIHRNIGAPGGEVSSLCPTPVPALSGLDVASIEAGGTHACAVLRTGEVY